MNSCCNPSANQVGRLASPAQAQNRRTVRAGFNRFIRLASPVAVDLTHFLYTDRPEADSAPRTTLTHYR